jgi:hypothetical protein
LKISTLSVVGLWNTIPVIANPYETVMLVEPIWNYYGVAEVLGGKQKFSKGGNVDAAYFNKLWSNLSLIELKI